MSLKFKFKIALFAILISGKAFSQQELLFSTQVNQWQANTINPALFPKDKKIAVGLGAFSFDQTHSGEVSLQDFLRKENGKTYLDFGQVIDRLEPTNNIQIGLRIETVSLGLKFGKWGLMFGHAIRQQGGGDYPQTLPSIIWKGNFQYVGKPPVDIAPVGGGTVFNEIGVGVSRKIANLTVAGRVKYLAGAAAFQTDPDHKIMTVQTSPDIYQLNLETDYAFHSSVIVNALDTAGLGYDLDLGEVKSLQLFSKNSGVAFDLGVTAKFTERLQVSASVLDLGGKIKWTENANYFKSKGKYEYNGIELPGADIISGSDSLDFGSKLDSLNDIFKFQKTAEEFSTELPTRFYASANLKLTEKWALAASLYHINGKNQNGTAVGAAAAFTPIPWLTVGAMYAVNNQSATNLGLNLNLKIGPLQGYFVSDNLLNLAKAKTAPALNFRFGGSLVF